MRGAVHGAQEFTGRLIPLLRIDRHQLLDDGLQSGGTESLIARGGTTIPLMIFMTIRGMSSPPNARRAVAIS